MQCRVRCALGAGRVCCVLCARGNASARARLGAIALSRVLHGVLYTCPHHTQHHHMPRPLSHTHLCLCLPPPRLAHAHAACSVRAGAPTPAATMAAPTPTTTTPIALEKQRSGLRMVPSFNDFGSMVSLVCLLPPLSYTCAAVRLLWCRPLARRTPAYACSAGGRTSWDTPTRTHARTHARAQPPTHPPPLPTRLRRTWWTAPRRAPPPCRASACRCPPTPRRASSTAAGAWAATTPTRPCPGAAALLTAHTHTHTRFDKQRNGSAHTRATCLVLGAGGVWPTASVPLRPRHTCHERWRVCLACRTPHATRRTRTRTDTRTLLNTRNTTQEPVECWQHVWQLPRVVHARTL
jgi:hypothetical protein